MSILALIFESHWYWLIGGLVLVLAEMFVSGVYLLWVGIGALVVGLFTAIWPQAAPWLQLAVLCVSMILSVVAGIYVQARWRTPAHGHELNTGLNALIGAHAQAADAFLNGYGRIRLNDSYYSAVAAEPVARHASVVVTGVQNGLLVVAVIS
jgi:hypothetical protein